MNYNFLYAKDPKYQLYAGVRFAASKLNYDVAGITVDIKQFNMGRMKQFLTLLQL